MNCFKILKDLWSPKHTKLKPKKISGNVEKVRSFSSRKLTFPEDEILGEGHEAFHEWTLKFYYDYYLSRKGQPLSWREHVGETSRCQELFHRNLKDFIRGRLRTEESIQCGPGSLAQEFVVWET